MEKSDETALTLGPTSSNFRFPLFGISALLFTRMASKRSKQKKKKTDPHKSGAGRKDASPQIPEASPRARALAWIGFSAVLLGCIAWVAVHAFLVDAVTVRLCNEADKNIPVEKRMPVFLSEIAFDGYAWNRYAEQLGENGEWRVRHADFDNAPTGRDQANWNSAFAWYLRGLGEIHRGMTGDSLRNSIYRMSIWANPILLVLALGIFATMSARRFGPLCGTVIAIGMVSTATFYEGFMPAYPDHHGITAFALMGLIFGIAWAGAGWVQKPGGKGFIPPHSIAQARHGMIFSAICGAAGLWISGFSAGVIAIGIGVGMIASVAIFSKKAPGSGCTYHSELWKLWGTVAGCGSLFFYILEFFPNHLGMRLEVNHPLYALAWFAGGWAISDITGWLNKPVWKLSLFPWLSVAACTVACSIMPVLILTGGSKYYTLLDEMILGIMNNTAEVLPLLQRISMGGLTWQAAFGYLPVFILIAFLLMFSRKVDAGSKAVLLLLIFPIILLTAMQFRQTRWGMLAGPLYIALAGLVVPQVWRLVPRGALNRGLAAVVLVSFGCLIAEPSFRNCYQIAWVQFRSGDKVSITAGQGLALLHRQMARAILDDAAGKPVVLLSSPNSSCLLACIGGFKTLGTLYWENVEGLKAAAYALNAQSDEEAFARLQKLGVTHVSLMTWENFIGPYFGIIHPKPVPGLSYEKSFGKRALFDKVIPPWARPIAFAPTDLSKGLQQNILMLRIAPEQSLNEAKFHLARFARLVEGNPITAEISLKEILDNDPNFVPARLELVRMKLEQKSYEDAVSQVGKALPLLPPDARADSVSSLSEILRNVGRDDLLGRLQKEAQQSEIQQAAKEQIQPVETGKDGLQPPQENKKPEKTNLKEKRP
ncbi:MAG: hypothetical protein WCL71_04105 [Deltaproteobacteria bacterium]